MQLNDSTKISILDTIIFSEGNSGDLLITSLNSSDDHEKEDYVFVVKNFEKTVFQMLEEPKTYAELKSKLLEDYEFDGMELDEYLKKYLEKLSQKSIINLG